MAYISRKNREVLTRFEVTAEDVLELARMYDNRLFEYVDGWLDACREQDQRIEPREYDHYKEGL